MRCEVVAIGTELLLGIITDTNSSWIGEQLALSGIDSHFQVKVGDNFERIESSIRTALERSDAVICCGGLGPTQDDITRDVIAHIMGGGMARDDGIAAEIQRRFEARGRTMSEIQREMRMVAEGVPTTESAYQLAHGRSIDMPITEQLYQVLYQGKSVPEGMMALQDRELKNEWTPY